MTNDAKFIYSFPVYLMDCDKFTNKADAFIEKKNLKKSDLSFPTYRKGALHWKYNHIVGFIEVFIDGGHVVANVYKKINESRYDYINSSGYEEMDIAGFTGRTPLDATNNEKIIDSIKNACVFYKHEFLSDGNCIYYEEFDLLSPFIDFKSMTK